MAETLGDLGEYGLIARIAANLPAGEDVLLGPGDDAAVVRAPDGRVVATTDLLVEGRHFRLDWSTPYDVGRRAAAQNLADVVAMGARPTALLVGFGAPATFPAAAALDLARGVADEAATAGAYVVGGDTVGADLVVVAVTALGDLAGRAPVTLGGARPGDVLVVCGTLGGSAAGLHALTHGLSGHDGAVAAYRVPAPPYAAGPLLAAAGATALTDVSDGLAVDLGQIARASGVGFDVDVAALPRHPGLAAFGDLAEGWVVSGGEDHALVATLPPAALAALGGCPHAVVGVATAEPGIRWRGLAGAPPEPYSHFGAAR